MNKTFWPFLVTLTLASGTMQGQISITSSGLPTANDTLVTEPATLLTTIDVEATGTDYFWDFGPEVLSIQPNATSLPCYDVNDTPLAYQFLFNNPFLYPAHNSEYGLGVDAFSLAGISFEDTYMYYKNSGGQYSITGMGASINGLPIAAQKIDPELIFHTPLDYNDADSSHSEMEFSVPTFGFYGQTVDRSYHCDGWGTMSIGGDTYEVLRVRTEISGADSVYIETFGFGLMLPRPSTVEYAWYCANFKVPLLQITTTQGVISNVVTAPLVTPIGIDELAYESKLFPNPATGQFRVPLSCKNYAIYDAEGHLVLRSNSQVVLCSDWPNGVYHFVNLNSGQTQKIVVTH